MINGLAARRWVLHLFILLQLMVVVLSPNPGNILYHTFSPLFLSYAGTFGFAQTWKFFAPEPGNARVAIIDLQLAGETVEQIQFPVDNKNGEFWDENYKRVAAFAALSTLNLERIEKYVKPWVCKTYPDMDSFSIQIREQPLDNIHRARMDYDGSRADVTKTVDWPATNFECERSK